MANSPLHIAGLFAGIGGLELGLARAGHHAELLCEIEPGAVAVLRERFPRVPVHKDVTTLDRLPKGVDCVVAGFPCQDLSQAGLTKGLRGKQSSLVDHVFRLLRRSEVRRRPGVGAHRGPMKCRTPAAAGDSCRSTKSSRRSRRSTASAIGRTFAGRRIVASDGAGQKTIRRGIQHSPPSNSLETARP